jgi:hypothetical protein
MLEIVGSLGYGGERLNTRLPKILAELQGLTVSGPLTGAGANTTISVPEGIDIQDTILKCLEFTSGVPSDITSTISIVSDQAQGTITLTTGLVAGDVVKVNGKSYTAVAGVPSNTNPLVGVGTFIDGVAIAALSRTADQIVAMQALGFGYAQAAALVAAGQLPMAAASLALAISGNDSSTLYATTAAGAVVTVVARAEGTAGNSITLDVSLSNSHATRSGATLTGGAAGNAYGTITLASAAVNDTVTVDGQTFTAVASGSPLTKNQFVGGTVTAQDLMNLGYLQGAANAILAVSNDAAAATVLAHQIEANDEARVSANNGLPVGPNGEILFNITNTQAGNATAVVTVTATFTGAAANAIVLTSGNGTREAVSGSGTLTAASHGIQSTSSTTGNTLLLWWYKKSRVVGQA